MRGEIVLARYGQVFRGVRTNLAAELGANGVVIYSDPADDGSTKGAVYPNGLWRAPDGSQRGSVQRLWRYPGDPLTPGRPATKHARRIDPKNSNLAKLPTIPISYASAKPILAHLGGAAAPASWQGGLPLIYRLGSGAAVHLDLQIRYRIRPVYDVTASIPGRTHPEQVVRIGAHHDAWAYGSDDNLSGAEAVLQIARGLASSSTLAGGRSERSNSAPGTARSTACSALPSTPRQPGVAASIMSSATSTWTALQGRTSSPPVCRRWIS